MSHGHKLILAIGLLTLSMRFETAIGKCRVHRRSLHPAYGKYHYIFLQLANYLLLTK